MATVILIGFSTSGKSHYLKQVDLKYPDKFSLLDSDEFISASHAGHIYNIYLERGRQQAIEEIERRETEFIQMLPDIEENLLIAAGPFIVIREGWDEFVKENNPFIIFLDRKAEKIYESLNARRQQQKKELDTQNPNFGSWDLDVLVKIENGAYLDLSKEKAIENIQMHLDKLLPIYKYYGNYIFDSDKLRIDQTESERLVDLILLNLQKNCC